MNDKVNSSNIFNRLLDGLINENYNGSFDECIMDLFFSDIANMTELSRIKTDGYGDAGADYMFFTCNKRQFYELSDLNEVKKDEKIDIYIIQVKNSSILDSNVPNKFIEYSTHVLNGTSAPEHYNDEVKFALDLTKEIIDKYSLKNIVNIHFYYISRVSDQQLNGADDLKGRMKSLYEMYSQFIPTVFKKISVNTISLEKIIEKSKDSNVLEYTFNNVETFKGAIGFDNNVGVIGLIPLADYYSFLIGEDGEINEKLFQSNIRDFKGKSGVNSNITKTLSDDGSLDFWWLNNGVTITCEDLLPGETQKQIYIKNPQIVNGLQTSYSIFNYYKDKQEKLQNDARKIFIKILKFDDSIADKELDVIVSTNSQNEIRDKDIHANDKVQQNIEIFFLQRGKYYQRKDKYYTNRKLPQKDIIRLADLAKYINTIYLKDPSSTRNNPGKLVEGSKYNTIFQVDNEQQDYERYWIAQLIYSKVVEKNKGKIIICDDEFDKSNFIHHIVYIIALLLCNDLDYKPSDLKGVNWDNITDELVTKAYEILIQVINTNSIKASKILKNIKESSFNKIINEYIKNHVFQTED